jgi:hypothetical protein
MKPLVDTSVFGLVPLPHVSKCSEWRHASEPLSIQAATLEDEEEPARSQCEVNRRGIWLRWLHAMWRNREGGEGNK